MKKIILLAICMFAHTIMLAQQIYFKSSIINDSMDFEKTMPIIAQQAIKRYKESHQKKYLNTLFRLQIISKAYSDANKTIETLRTISKESSTAFPELFLIQHELFSKAKLKQNASNENFDIIFKHSLSHLFSSLDDKSAAHINTYFQTRNGWKDLYTNLQGVLKNLKNKDSLSLSESLDLCRNYYVYYLYKNIEEDAKFIIEEDDKKRYIIEDSVLIKTKEGITLSAIVVRKKNMSQPQPTALVFTIYTEFEQNILLAKRSAAHGYVGVVADSRGKRLSPDAIVPYEHDGKDAHAVIDWITKQTWSNGKVGMFGGSYLGFTQWAATKYMHPALKTIVPYVAAIPGQGLPMENNIPLNANYAWPFYVSNNKYLDDATYNSPHWRALPDKWYQSGASYRRFDSIDGTPNPFFQTWLKHPAYDQYWQNMVPYKNEFSKITIPVLSITGYYDDGQISALQYLKEHYKYNKKANHYLIIGPYDHLGAQRGGTAILRDYAVDPIALINTPDITYQWLDYILRDGKKPELLKDKINYEVMGTNTWKHAPSLEKMHNAVLTFYLSDIKKGHYFELNTKKTTEKKYIQQSVDFVDRNISHNNDYYPYPIIKDELDTSNGLFFMSAPFKQSCSIDGTFLGELKASINKKDMDIGITLYEVLPDGKFFHLSYYLGRASYAKDITSRQLLTPNTIETIPFDKTRMVSKQISKGSKLLVVLNINKNPFAEINYGTGKNVSDESIKDAGEPLQIKWYNDSYIQIPVWR
jgi:uncharacterized protein